MSSLRCLATSDGNQQWRSHQIQTRYSLHNCKHRSCLWHKYQCRLKNTYKLIGSSLELISNVKVQRSLVFCESYALRQGAATFIALLMCVNIVTMFLHFPLYVNYSNNQFSTSEQRHSSLFSSSVNGVAMSYNINFRTCSDFILTFLTE